MNAYNVAENGLRTTPCSQCALYVLAIDELLEYARLALDGNLQMWVGGQPWTVVVLIPPNSGELNHFKTFVVCSSKIDI